MPSSGRRWLACFARLVDFPQVAVDTPCCADLLHPKSMPKLWSDLSVDVPFRQIEQSD